LDSPRNTTPIILNRLIYYPTGSYGTFIQWLCNTPTISGPEDLPFHIDGNSHKYVLSDQFKLLVSDQDTQEFVSTKNHNVVSCIPPIDHNSKLYNEHGQENFYYQTTLQHINYFDQYGVKILVLYPTATSKIWWWHNNCKKVFYTEEMFDKKIKNAHPDIPWLTTTDPVQRAGVQMNYYQDRIWYKTLLQQFQCADAHQLSLGQLRTTMARAIYNETFDSLSHWQKLPVQLPNVKFVSLDQLRDHTKDTIQDIFRYFNVESDLPLEFVLDQWTALQTTRNRDQEHSNIINCIVNGQHYDWSDLNFDLFDEVYLYYALKFQHNIALNADHADCLPANTHDLLLLR
jgi:hypothetical protein